MEVDIILDSSTINSGAIASTSNNSTRKETAPIPHGIDKSLLIPPPGYSLVIPPSARFDGGLFSKVYTEDIKNSLKNKNPYKHREVYQNAVLYCVRIYICMSATLERKN